MKRRIISILILLIAFTTASFAQYEAPQIIYENGNGLGYIGNLAVADLDRDGLNDVVMIAPYNYRLSWYKSFGDGVFSNERIISDSTYQLSGLIVTDLNGDSTLDLVAVDDDQGKVIWFPNDGLASFDTVLSLHPDMHGVKFIDIADLDNSGTPDIILSGLSTNSITWFSNSGDAVFSFEDSLSTGNYYSSGVRNADIDGDGDLDIMATTHYYQNMLFYENLGGHFSAPVYLYSPVDMKRFFDIVDIDNDLDLDVVVYQSNEVSSNDGQYGVYYFENVDSVFTDTAIELISMEHFNGVFLLEDFTGDGLLDLIRSEYTFTYEYMTIEPVSVFDLYVNLGNGQFEEKRPIVNEEVRNASMAAGDLSGDGIPDLVFSEGNQILWIDNHVVSNQDGNPMINVVNDSIHQGRISGEYYVGDISGDNEKDVLLNFKYAHNPAYAFRILESNGTGGFQEAEDLFDPITPSDASAFFVQDIDGDNNPDVLQSYQNNGIVWFKGNEQGDFDLTGNITLFEQFEDLSISEVKDMDNNGTPDLLCLAMIDSQQYVYVVYNTGNGNFEIASEISNVGFELSARLQIMAGDIDGDDDVDITGVAYLEDPSIIWLMNENNNSYSALQLDSLGLTSNYLSEIKVDMADLQGSGDLEMFVRFYKEEIFLCGFTICFHNSTSFLVLDYVEDEWSLVERYDYFPFETPYSYYPVGYEQSLLYGDYNLDSNIDLLFFHRYLSSIVWLLGDGTGHFTDTVFVSDEHNLLNYGYFPWLVYADIDNDLDLDVFAMFGVWLPFNNANRLLYFKNTSPPVDQDGDGYNYLEDCDDTDSTITNYIPEPLLTDDLSVCMGDAFQLSISQIIEAFSYEWTGPSGFQSTEAEPIISSTTLSNTGVYSVVASNEDCVSDPSTIQVVVNELPDADLALVGSNELTISSAGIVAYQWFFNGDSIPGETSPTILLDENGIYQVAVVDANGCQALSDEYSFTLTAAAFSENQVWMKIYPNPSQNVLHIEIGKSFTDLDYVVMSLSGKVMLKGIISGDKADINIEEIPAGFYLIEFRNDNHFKAFEFCVVK